ncbi:Arv1-domain-containing protein [Lentinula aciculospora]|uniref:Protein ARV n=1 Tax=Lentinula aciculospora TaxID=153920 RepID=A0A9W9DQJ4_9AGAR|nr:Arv1-domain-containing protein [Lentinula aciculospora]
MPVCTTCTSWLPYLYTVYQSAYNLRLEQCPNCHSFADPYVEHDDLTLLIDLLLLKRAVYRHLLYNRGSTPRREDGKIVQDSDEQLERRRMTTLEDGKELVSSRWRLVLRLGLTLTFVDAFIRWSHLITQPTISELEKSSNISPWAIETISGFAIIFFGCCLETIAFHAGIIFACYVVLASGSSFWRSQSDIRREFRIKKSLKPIRFSLIPLALFYSSFTKLFFLFLLTIWRPSRSSQPQSSSDGDISFALPLSCSIDILSVLEFMKDENLDREWVVRNVMGGMSAGFGLRVILNINPLFTTLIILFGWVMKTFASRLISGWIGGNVATAEAWLASSIP